MKLTTFALVLLSFLSKYASGADSFSADVDERVISMDESVSLRFNIKSEGASSGSTEPRFNAPGFDIVGDFQSQSIQSVYDNGRLSVQNVRTLTKVLRPKRKGKLTITNMSVKINGRTYRAEPIVVSVKEGGQGTPPPRGATGGGYGLRGSEPSDKSPKSPFFLRAELNKSKAYKGEQIVVSYYLYAAVKVFNIETLKYPVLEGFLREDLKVPVLNRRLNWKLVTIGGRNYQKALLARYAAYPIKGGTLKIDKFTVRASYHRNSAVGRPGDDPFQMFFSRLSPSQSTKSSPTIKVQIKELPENGRPNTFSGGVGEFEVTSSINSRKVRANEPVKLLVKVEGKGNVAAIQEPNGDWPDSLELYETKSRSKTSKGAVSEKVFEYLIIPRRPGKVEIPKLDFVFFNPKTKKYRTKSTKSVILDVGQPAPGTKLVERKDPEGLVDSRNSGAEEKKDIRYIMEPGSQKPGESALARWARMAAIASFGIFLIVGLGVAGSRVYAKMSGARARGDVGTEWRNLGRSIQTVSKTDAEEIARAYEKFSNTLLDSIGEIFEMSARSMPRKDLGILLTQEKDLSLQDWSEIEQVLLSAESIQYAGISDPAKSSRELKDLYRSGSKLVDRLRRRK